MKPLFLPIVAALIVLFVSCSRYQVVELDYDDRLVDEEELLEMPAFERNQEVCKRSILALQRAEIMANISVQLSQISTAKDRVVVTLSTKQIA